MTKIIKSQIDYRHKVHTPYFRKLWEGESQVREDEDVASAPFGKVSGQSLQINFPAMSVSAAPREELGLLNSFFFHTDSSYLRDAVKAWDVPVAKQPELSTSTLPRSLFHSFSSCPWPSNTNMTRRSCSEKGLYLYTDEERETSGLFYKQNLREKTNMAIFSSVHNFKVIRLFLIQYYLPPVKY